MLNIEGFIYGYFLAHFMPGMLLLGAVFGVLKIRGIVGQISISNGFLFMMLSILLGAIIDGFRHKLENYKRSRHKILRLLQYPFLSPCEDCNEKKDCYVNKVPRYREFWYYSTILGLDVLNSLINRFYYFYEFYINTSLSLGISILMVTPLVYTLKIPFDNILLFSLILVSVLLFWLLALFGVNMRCNYNKMVANAIFGANEKEEKKNGKKNEEIKSEESNKKEEGSKKEKR